MKQAVSSLFDRTQLAVIAGPCVIESYDLCMKVGEFAKGVCDKLNIAYIFKASFDKANRTSISSFRGPGLDEGLEVLARVSRELGSAVLTDVHLPQQAAPASEAVDVLQIPAFLCRQTDLIAAAAATGCPTNIKKGQFVAPADMAHVAKKFRESGGKHLSLTERGASFGYNNLVVDMRALPWMRETTDAAIVFDATHSVQRPSAAGGVTGGDRDMAPVLARAAAAVGIDGLFCEVHPNPNQALSDGPNSLTFELFEQTLRDVAKIRAALS